MTAIAQYYYQAFPSFTRRIFNINGSGRRTVRRPSQWRRLKQPGIVAVFWQNASERDFRRIKVRLV